MKKIAFAAACVLAAFSLPAFADDTAPGKAMGAILVDAKGMTLYYFDKDSATQSACSGGCVNVWPPLTASANAKASGNWTIIDREDGKQWAYKGHPLYLFSTDLKVGDKMGDGISGAWHVAKP